MIELICGWRLVSCVVVKAAGNDLTGWALADAEAEVRPEAG